MSVWGSIVGEIHVLLAALVLFILLPRWALSRRRKSEVGARVLALGVAFWVVAVTVLAYVSSVRYSLLAVIAVVGLAAALRLGITPVEPVRAADAALPDPFRLWDAFEQPAVTFRHWRQGLFAGMRRICSEFRAHYGVVGALLMVLAMGWALIYGSWPWLHQVGPGTLDGYTDLLRIASLSSNTGVYPSGVAPMGVSALGAAITTAFFLPPLNVLRFLYPLADVFTVMAAGVLSHQLTRSGRASALVMFLVSVSSLAHLGFPINFESPLSMHWAVILVLLAWAEALAWDQSRERTHAILAGLCLLAASLTSPPEAVAGVSVVAGLTLGRGWQVAGWGILGTVLGLLPLVGGVATGHAFSPNGWLQAGFPALTAIWHNPESSAYWLSWTGVGLGLVRAIWPAEAIRRRFSYATGLVAVTGAFLGWSNTVASMILWSGLLGLMVLIAGVDIFVVVTEGRARFRPADAGLAGLAALGLMLPASGPVLHQYEPPLAAAATLKIEQSLPPYEWTIISPVGQYSEVLSRGWHQELSVFAQTYSMAEAENPRYQLRHDPKAPILTPNVFLFVEPRLYPSGTGITRADLALSIARGASTYRGRSLASIEARAYFWAMAYHKSHPRTSQIYVSSPNLMVLWIRQ